MKTLFLFISITILFGSMAFSQVYVNGTNINELPQVNFCEMTSMGLKGKASLDYGQKDSFLKSDFITDEHGETIKFNSRMHLVNFMYNNGWELYKFGVRDTSFDIYVFKRIGNSF